MVSSWLSKPGNVSNQDRVDRIPKLILDPVAAMYPVEGDRYITLTEKTQRFFAALSPDNRDFGMLL